ncbi:MAG TPA: SRPBCC domain-containing protein [archaeon]|nr:SRPBCC domain-containing protein [archaeon]
MKTSLKQVIIIKAEPHDVYEIYMDERKHSIFTDSKATITKKEGGKFSAYDGYATGKILELAPDKKIIQSWRADDWPDKHISIIKITLKKIKEGTELKFIQTDVPEEHVAVIEKGWHDFYWKPMKKILEK